MAIYLTVYSTKKSMIPNILNHDNKLSSHIYSYIYISYDVKCSQLFFEKLWLSPLKLSEDLMEFLHTYGVKVNSADAKGRTALHVAAANDDVDGVCRLMEWGADVTWTVDKMGENPMKTPWKNGKTPWTPWKTHENMELWMIWIKNHL